MEFKCPYCGGGAILADSILIYKKSHGLVFMCENWPECDSYVGTHKHNLEPLGRLANKELRYLKKEAHKLLDGMWRRKKAAGVVRARRKTYKWLSRQLKILEEDCHIGMFDKETTLKVIKICKEVKKY